MHFFQELTGQELWAKIADVSAKIAEMEKAHPELLDRGEKEPATTSSSLELDNMPPIPEYFKLGVVQSIDDDKMEIRISVHGSTAPCVHCGDGCRVNEKGSKGVEKKLGIPSPKSRCMSHISHGMLRVSI